MPEKQKTLTPRVLIQLLVFIILLPMAPILIPWRWGWWEGWVYALGSILGFIISRYLAWRRNPDILSERGKFLQHDNTERFDQILAPLLGLAGGFIPLAAGLDARFGTPMQVAPVIKALAVVFFLAGMMLGSYALIANRFFSGTVRMQADRGQHVIKSGPYHWVRHPGYSGALLTYIACPFLFNSLWTFIPVICTFIVIFIRTALEDQTLREKLAGYQEYAEEVRYRLLPGIW